MTGVVWSADGSRRATLVSTNESRRRESPAGAREPSAPEAALVRRLPPSHHSETKRVDSPVDCPRVGSGSNSVCGQGTMSSSGPQQEVGPGMRLGGPQPKSTPLLYQCFLRAIYRTVPVPYRTDGSDVARCRQHACEEARRPQPASLGFVPAVLRSCVLWLLAACIAAALRKSNRQASRDPCAARRPALEFATHCRSSREARPRRARPCATRPGGSPR